MEIIARSLLEAYDFGIYINKVVFRQSGKNQREQKTRVLKDTSMSGTEGVGLVLSVWCCGWALTGAGVNSGAPAAQ